jgi:hypothetical protein
MNTRWDIKVETWEESQAPITTQLAAFDGHKEALVDKLLGAYERGPKFEPFDSNKSWRDLTSIATLYFWNDRMKPETIPAGARVKRLRYLQLL